MTQTTLEELNKKIDQLRKDFEKIKEDLEFSNRIRGSWKSYDRGEFKSMEKEDFLKELDKW